MRARDLLHDDTLWFLLNAPSEWIAFREPVHLRWEGEETAIDVFGVYNYVEDLHVFYVERWPNALVVTEGHPDKEPWTMFNTPAKELSDAFVAIVERCVSMTRYAAAIDRALDVENSLTRIAKPPKGLVV